MPVHHQQFEQIVLLDPTGLVPASEADLQACSRQPVRRFDTLPQSEAEVIDRIGEADAVLVSWNTSIPAAVLRGCPNLRYVGMCCSLYDPASANVDVLAANKLGITVRGVRDYGDEGVVEFIFSALIRLAQGLGDHQWQAEPVELSGRRLGIIGLGAVGSLLAQRALAFGMEVRYFSRTRKPEREQEDLQYQSLSELLAWSEIVSTHTPKNSLVLDQSHFEALGSGKVFVNTSLGATFERSAFLAWLERPGNYALFDGDGMSGQADLASLPRVIATEHVGGWTREARARLSAKVVEQLQHFLAG